MSQVHDKVAMLTRELSEHGTRNHMLKFGSDIYIYFNYLAAPRPTLGHYWGDSLAHPVLITAF